MEDPEPPPFETAYALIDPVNDAETAEQEAGAQTDPVRRAATAVGGNVKIRCYISSVEFRFPERPNRPVVITREQFDRYFA